MRSSIWGGAAAFVVLASALAAADFWDQSEFVDWTDKDVQKMLFDSPWAKEVQIARGGAGGMGGGMGGGGRGMGGPGGGRGGGGGIGGAGGGRGGARGRGDAPGGGGMAMPVIRFIVRWHSAMPVKQALIRSAIGAEGDLTDEHRTFLDREEKYYIVMLSGIPQRVAARFADDIERLKSFASLERKGKAALAPEQAEVRQTPHATDLFFLFPRADAVTLEDKDVEFVFETGRGRDGGPGMGLEIKKKFKLKDMLFDGALSL